MNELYTVDGIIATDEERDPSVYPELYNLSAAFMYRFMARPVTRAKSEFLYLPIQKFKARGSKFLELVALIGEWNLAWEQAQLRTETIYYKKAWRNVRKSLPHRKFLRGRNVYYRGKFRFRPAHDIDDAWVKRTKKKLAGCRHSLVFR